MKGRENQASSGFMVLQDHDQSWPLESREWRGAIRMTGKDQYGRRKATKAGDILCATVWEPTTRKMHGWAFSWPAIVQDDIDGIHPPTANQAPVTGPGMKGVALLPIRSEEYDSDSRFDARRSVTNPQWNVLPRGWVGLSIGGTEERTQQATFLSCDPRLIAVNNEPKGVYGTLVADIEGGELAVSEGEPGKGGLVARLQTMMRVAKMPERLDALDIDNPGSVVCWNGAATGQERWPGFAAYWSRAGAGGKSHTTEDQGPVVTGGGVGPARAGRRDTRRNGAGSGGVVAFMDQAAYGPLHPGDANDKHQIGRNPDGNPINSGHISTNTYHFMDRDRDGPQLFETIPPKYGEYPLGMTVHQSWEPKLNHPWIKGTQQGYWVWWGTVPYMQSTPDDPPPPPPPPPTTPPPTTPPPPPPSGPPPVTPGPTPPPPPPPGPVTPPPTLPGPVTPGGGPPAGPPPEAPPPPPPPPPPPGPVTGPGTKGPQAPPGESPPPGDGDSGSDGDGDSDDQSGKEPWRDKWTGDGEPPNPDGDLPPPWNWNGSSPYDTHNPRSPFHRPPPVRDPSVPWNQTDPAGNPYGPSAPRDPSIPWNSTRPAYDPYSIQASRSEVDTWAAYFVETTLGQARGAVAELSEAQASSGGPEPQTVRPYDYSTRPHTPMVFSPGAWALPTIVFRPQGTTTQDVDTRYGVYTEYDAKVADATRPNSLRMEGWAGQLPSGAWSLSQPGGRSAGGSSAGGGVAVMPPEIDIVDARDCMSRAPTTNSPTHYVAFAPGTAVGHGKPDVTTGDMADGAWRQYRDSSAGSTGDAAFRTQRSEAGVWTDVVTHDTEGSTFHQAGYVQLPSGTDAERPSSPAAGMVRWNEDGTEAEVYDGADWVPLGGSSSVLLTRSFARVNPTAGMTAVAIPIEESGTRMSFVVPTAGVLRAISAVFSNPGGWLNNGVTFRVRVNGSASSALELYVAQSASGSGYTTGAGVSVSAGDVIGLEMDTHASYDGTSGTWDVQVSFLVTAP